MKGGRDAVGGAGAGFDVARAEADNVGSETRREVLLGRSTELDILAEADAEARCKALAAEALVTRVTAWHWLAAARLVRDRVEVG